MRNGLVGPFGAFLCSAITLTFASQPVALGSSIETQQPAVADRVVQWGGEGTPPIETEQGVQAISASMHFLALVDGQVYAWGRDVAGETYVPEEAQEGVTAIAAGNAYSLAIKDGAVIGWGSHPAIPTELQSGVSQIAAGYTHALALKDGRVITWGSSRDGLGDVPTEAQSGVSAIAAGAFFSMALKNGKVIVWGDASAFHGPANPKNIPREVSEGVSAISATFYRAMALKNGGAIGWGFGNWVTPPEAQSGVTAIAAGWEYFAAVKDGKPITWGGFSTPTTGGLTAIAAGNGALLGIQQPTVPSAPISPSAGPADRRATVSWQPPPFDGGLPVSGYTATASPGGQTCTTNGDLTCTVTGLTNGTAYTFTVTATSAAGTSPPSDPSPAVTPIGKPGSVTELKATAAKGSIRVTWSPPTNIGGSTSVTYQYRVGKQTWRSTSATSVMRQGQKGVKITVSVRSVNSAGAGPAVSVSGIPK